MTRTARCLDGEVNFRFLPADPTAATSLVAATNFPGHRRASTPTSNHNGGPGDFAIQSSRPIWMLAPRFEVSVRGR